jgi:hypothetical protein
MKSSVGTTQSCGSTTINNATAPAGQNPPPCPRRASNAIAAGQAGTATLASFSIGTPTRLPYSVQEPS